MSADSDRRQELRVHLPIQLWFNVLEKREDFIRGHSAVLAGVEDLQIDRDYEGRDELERHVLRLEKKIDIVISLLADKMVRKEYRYRGSILDVSESGLRFMSPIALVPGQTLEMGIGLPSQSFRTMDIAGQVVWETEDENRTTENGNLIGVHFTDILTEDQDELVHWIFQKQRAEIRRLREEEATEED